MTKKTPKRNKRANPNDGVERTVITEEDKLAAATLLSNAGWKRGKRAPRGSMIAAAKVAGVSTQAVDKWVKKEEYKLIIESIQSEVITNCVDDLVRGSRGLNPTSSIFLLRSLDPERFDDKTKHIKLKHKLDMEKQKLANAGIEKAATLAPRIQIIPSDPKHVEAFADKYDLILSAINSSKE